MSWMPEVRRDEDEIESFPTEPPAERLVEPDMEAAGIEPASYSFPKDPSCRTFSFTTNICGIDFEVVREGKHLNLHLYEEGQVWRFEEIDQNLVDRLNAIAHFAQEAHDGTD